MAEPVRRRIVEVLASGEAPAGEIVGVVGTEFRIRQPSVSHHLKVLRDNNWVDVRIDGTLRLYRLNDEALALLELEVEELRHTWERRIGEIHNREPNRHDAEAFELTKPAQQRDLPRVGSSARGLRGGDRSDLWRS